MAVLLLTASLSFAQENKDDEAEQQQQQQQQAAERRERAAQQRQQQAAQQQRAAQQRQQQAAQQRATTGGGLGALTGVAVNTTARMLRIHPAGMSDRQDHEVIIGEEFASEISFDNQDFAPFDEIRVILSYDPDYLEPLAISDRILADRLLNEPTAEIDTLAGILLYEAQLSEPIILNDTPILRIRWKALDITRGTPVEFGSRGEYHTAVVGFGEERLGDPRVPGDGTLNMSVVILPENPREAEAFLNDPAVFRGSEGKIGGVQLYIQPQEEPIIAGKPFHFDIILDNRAYSNLDNVGVILQFNPEVIEIIDTDVDNPITIGRNIHDGPYREMFPWNIHVDNTVFQHRGIISYRMGTDEPEMTRGKYGPIARVHALAKKPTAGTPFIFKFSQRPGIRGTEATFNGQDALGDPQFFGDGARGAVFTILPDYERELAARSAGETSGNAPQQP